MALTDLSEEFREIRSSVERVNFTDVKLSEKFKKEYGLYETTPHPSPNGFGLGFSGLFANCRGKANELVIRNYE